MTLKIGDFCRENTGRIVMVVGKSIWDTQVQVIYLDDRPQSALFTGYPKRADTKVIRVEDLTPIQVNIGEVRTIAPPPLPEIIDQEESS